MRHQKIYEHFEYIEEKINKAQISGKKGGVSSNYRTYTRLSSNFVLQILQFKAVTSLANVQAGQKMIDCLSLAGIDDDDVVDGVGASSSSCVKSTSMLDMLIFFPCFVRFSFLAFIYILSIYSSFFIYENII